MDMVQPAHGQPSSARQKRVVHKLLPPPPTPVVRQLHPGQQVGCGDRGLLPGRRVVVLLN